MNKHAHVRIIGPDGEPTCRACGFYCDAIEGHYFDVDSLAAALLDRCLVGYDWAAEEARLIIQAAKGHDSTLCPDPDCFNGHHPANEAERE